MLSIRSFIAIQTASFPPLAAFLRRLAPLGKAVRPVLEDQLHVALRFLGEVDQRQVASIAEALGETLSGVRSFQLAIKGVGAFPSECRPSVVWVGL